MVEDPEKVTKYKESADIDLDLLSIDSRLKNIKTNDGAFYNHVIIINVLGSMLKIIKWLVLQNKNNVKY